MVDAAAALGRGELAKARLEQANINPQTGLATDYLNHFNEVVMLLEMLPAMPDCAEDVLEWTPLSYEAHFEKSGFSEKQLAITAYRAAPDELREALTSVVRRIDDAVLAAQSRLRQADEPVALANSLAEEATMTIKPLVAVAGAIIHGHVDTQEPAEDESQAAIDALFA
ncbi:hypothetical protein H2509_19190 [Stappia sp. F7233]|uniref:Uncharacterized protein n=1 Tax=Stappia albiluteola TaxID=2758565 RepID=A0A839AHD0_9HYPH|nr:hypothetical protein [Stappia albiluteola]MBA5779260.1 hypothetical protein [Stappia albiluteola]